MTANIALRRRFKPACSRFRITVSLTNFTETRN